MRSSFDTLIGYGLLIGAVLLLVALIAAAPLAGVIVLGTFLIYVLPRRKRDRQPSALDDDGDDDEEFLK